MLVILTAPGGPALAQSGDDPDFAEAVRALNERSFKRKAGAVRALAATGGPRSREVLSAMLDGRLYYRKNDKTIVIAEASENGFRIVDAVTGSNLGEVGKREIRKIRVNNQLRGTIRGAIARLSLSDPDAGVRLDSVQRMLGGMTPETVALLMRAAESETDPRVREKMALGIALGRLEDDGADIRLAAIDTLTGSLEPIVRGALNGVAANDPDPDVRLAAEEAIKSIQARLKAYAMIETTFFGLSLGSVLLLAAIGLAITFGVMGVINMAHGELIMLGAYTTYVVQLMMPNHIDYSLFVAVPLAFLVSGLFGVAIERGVIRLLYGRPLETLLATFGISLILQQLVRSVFSPLNRSVSTPSWMSGSLEINSALSLTYNRLYILLFALMVFLALLLILKKTSLGLQVRAVAQNRAMARAMGVRAQWVDALTFGLGSGIAGVAGVALSQLTNVGPNLGQAYIIDSFMVVVFGGVGNLWGTLVGSMTLGVANKFLEPWAGAVLAKILVLVFIIAFIQKRPRGLFPQKGRAAEN
ncbi:MAG: urea ABC transporter permease subunit UrtB [Pseudomonadota bacterium]|nr:urea ABC transporter permease subunit UrtB [Pseudomonadota bacterium]